MNLKQHHLELSKKQVEEFRTKLETWQAELRAAAGQVAKEGREIVDDSAVDVGDRAVNSSTKEILFRQAHEHRRLLHMVEAALERIRNGSFGECLTCEGLIGSRRLEAVPWTQYCVTCQEKRERGESLDSDD